MSFAAIDHHDYARPPFHKKESAGLVAWSMMILVGLLLVKVQQPTAWVAVAAGVALLPGQYMLWLAERRSRQPLYLQWNETIVQMLHQGRVLWEIAWADVKQLHRLADDTETFVLIAPSLDEYVIPGPTILDPIRYLPKSVVSGYYARYGIIERENTLDELPQA